MEGLRDVLRLLAACVERFGKSLHPGAGWELEDPSESLAAFQRAGAAGDEPRSVPDPARVAGAGPSLEGKDRA